MSASMKSEKFLIVVIGLFFSQFLLGVHLPLLFQQEDEVFVAKKKTLEALMEKIALVLFRNKTIDQICFALNTDPEFTRGESAPFLCLENGTCLASYHEPDLVWKNLKNFTDIDRESIVDLMIQGTENNWAGWISYRWNGVLKTVYVRRMIKDQKNYFLGIGFYPDSRKEMVSYIVKKTATLIKKYGIEKALDELQKRNNLFEKGDMAPFIFVPEGKCLIGYDQIGMKQKKVLEKSLLKLLIKTAQAGGGWVSYPFNGMEKYGYIEQVAVKNKEPKTSVDEEKYFIGAGFFPELTKDTIIEIVRQIESYCQSWGKEKTCAKINKYPGGFSRGAISLSAFNHQGICIAAGKHPDLIGKNLTALKDDEGRPLIHMENLLKGSQWTCFRFHNALMAMYVQQVVVGEEPFFITAGFYPFAHCDESELLVKDAIKYLQFYGTEKSFEEFSKKDGSFVRGDLSIMAYDFQGICLVDGYHKQFLWNNFLKVSGPKGKLFVKSFIEKAKSGGGWLSYDVHNVCRHVYIEPITLKCYPEVFKKSFFDNGSYAICSGYFE